MSNEFLKSNPRLDRTVNESTNFEDMREALKTELTKQGVITRNVREDGNYGARLMSGQHAAPTPEVSLPETPARETCVRVIYPHLNDRFEIHGVSEAELDQKEEQIRSLYSGATK
jgi:hypothetical protein